MQHGGSIPETCHAAFSVFLTHFDALQFVEDAHHGEATRLGMLDVAWYPFSAAWVRALKYGWTQSCHLENEVARQRMLQAFQAVGLSANAGLIDTTPIEDQAPRTYPDGVIDVKWLADALPHVVQAHQSWFASAFWFVQFREFARHGKTYESEAEAVENFYRNLLTIAWGYGWRAGLDEAHRLHVFRNMQQGRASSRSAEEAKTLEDHHMQDLFDQVFPKSVIKPR